MLCRRACDTLGLFLRVNVGIRTPCSSWMSTLIHTDDRGHKWHVACSLYLQRLPLIAPSMSPLEQEFSEVKLKEEVDNSLYSLHEIGLIHEHKIKQQKQNDESSVKVGGNKGGGKLGKEESVGGLTLREEEDTWMKRLNDLKAMLADSPDQVNEDDIQNSMRHASQRVTYAAATDILRTNFKSVGNAKLIGTVPFASHTLKVKKEIREQIGGAHGYKIYVMHALTNGAVGAPLVDNYAWFTLAELKCNLPFSYAVKLNVLFNN